MGYTDAQASAANPGDAHSTLKYFGLKRKGDKRMKGMSYERFLEMERVGHFDDFEVLADKKLGVLFSQ